MKTKLILNSALSMLVALGVAACSSGGGSAPVAEASVKKTAEQVKPQTSRPTETAKETKAAAPAEAKKEAIQPAETPPVANQNVDVAVEKKLNDQPGAYASLAVLNNETLNVEKLNALIKENINYSSAKQLRIATDEGKYATSSDAVLFLASEDSLMLVTATNPNVSGWKYQTIAQVSDYSTNEEGVLGFMSIGQKSKASAIPTEGTVTYQGKVTGRSLLQHNELKNGTVQADVTVDVNFSTKAVTFKTQNTKLRNMDTSALDLTGSATLDSAKNALVEGKVYLTQTPEYKGELKGALFGSNAEEVGGTFNIEGGKLTGAFGAKQ